MKGSTMFSLSQ